MNLLNLGCGATFHPDWINIDFIATNENVVSHDLRKGIPFDNEQIDVLYNSHILEHFQKNIAVFFLNECYRVLKPNGIIRIAVPDLERIAREYLRNLDRAIEKVPNAEFDYDWILLEMYDQTVRNESGGEMAKFFSRTEIPNNDYIISRIGDEAKLLHNSYLDDNLKTSKVILVSRKFNIKRKLTSFSSKIKRGLLFLLFRSEYDNLTIAQEELKIGRFRLAGEVHLWMYDRYSVTRLLKNCGFRDIKLQDAFTSNIPNWNEFNLDSKNGIPRKPDSLYIEAKK